MPSWMAASKGNRREADRMNKKFKGSSQDFRFIISKSSHYEKYFNSSLSIPPRIIQSLILFDIMWLILGRRKSLSNINLLVAHLVQKLLLADMTLRQKGHKPAPLSILSTRNRILLLCTSLAKLSPTSALPLLISSANLISSPTPCIFSSYSSVWPAGLCSDVPLSCLPCWTSCTGRSTYSGNALRIVSSLVPC